MPFTFLPVPPELLLWNLTSTKGLMKNVNKKTIFDKVETDSIQYSFTYLITFSLQLSINVPPVIQFPPDQSLFN